MGGGDERGDGEEMREEMGEEMEERILYTSEYIFASCDHL